MTETYISKEAAILVKEKGYEQNPYKTANCYAPEFTDGSNVRLVASLFHPSVNIAVAPTQSLLQKWLREKHRIEVTPYSNASGFHWDLSKSFNKEWWSGGTHIADSSMSGPNNAGGWDVYEEALEAGLIAALNRI